MFGGGGSEAQPVAARGAPQQGGGGFTIPPKLDAFLGAASAALMSGNAAAFAPTYQALIDSATRQNETAAGRQAISMVLQKQGMSPEEANLAAVNPQAAQMMIDLIKQKREAAQLEAASRSAGAIASGGMNASPAPAAPQPQAPTAPSPGGMAAPQSPAPAQAAPSASSAPLDVETQRRNVQARIEQLRLVKSTLPERAQGPYAANIKNLEDQLKALPEPLVSEKRRLEIQNLESDIATKANPAKLEAMKQIGEAEGKVAVAAPSSLAAALTSLKAAKDLRAHPSFNDEITSLNGGLGKVGLVNRQIPGSQAYDFNSRVEQLKGKTFLEAFNALKGGGAITKEEGEKATIALGRLDAALTPKDFTAALDDLEGVVKTGMKRAKEMGLKYGTIKPGEFEEDAKPGISKAEYDALPSGAQFPAPDGTIRRKP
jgi:hypothetical protein